MWQLWHCQAARPPPWGPPYAALALGLDCYGSIQEKYGSLLGSAAAAAVVLLLLMAGYGQQENAEVYLAQVGDPPEHSA